MRAVNFALYDSFVRCINRVSGAIPAIFGLSSGENDDFGGRWGMVRPLRFAELTCLRRQSSGQNVTRSLFGKAMRLEKCVSHDPFMELAAVLSQGVDWR